MVEGKKAEIIKIDKKKRHKNARNSASNNSSVAVTIPT